MTALVTKSYRVTKITADTIRTRGKGLGSELLPDFELLYPKGISLNAGNTAGKEEEVWDMLYSCPVLRKLVWLMVDWGWLPKKPVISNWDKYDLTDIMFTDMDLSGVDWSGKDLNDIFVWNCDLTDADLSGCRVHNAQFTHLDLAYTNIDGIIGWDKAASVYDVKLRGFTFNSQYLRPWHRTQLRVVLNSHKDTKQVPAEA